MSDPPFGTGSGTGIGGVAATVTAAGAAAAGDPGGADTMWYVRRSKLSSRYGSSGAVASMWAGSSTHAVKEASSSHSANRWYVDVPGSRSSSSRMCPGVPRTRSATFR